MTRPILVLGATGLFGGHLARRLLGAGHEVVPAGRDAGRLAAFAAAWGGRPQAFDRRDAAASAAALKSVRPFAVVDAAGPFQTYGSDPYRFARQVLESGAHYLDLADAADFVAGIGVLDPLARELGLAAISGASSTPAISAAAADALAEGLDEVESVEVAILPGNRTERGLSVTRAILAQAGQPFRLWRGGRWEGVRGWDDTRPVTLRVGGRDLVRPGALVETPDTRLFPDRYGARTVIFRAGLELPVLHRGLALSTLLVRFGLLRSLSPLAVPAFRLASLLRSVGSDEGGMTVAVLGRSGARWERRVWTLVAGDGMGPRIPAEPAALIAERLLQGAVAPGARSAAGVLSLPDCEAGLAALGVSVERRSETVTPLVARAVGDAFATLPAAVRGLHSAPGVRRYAGRADIDGPEGPLARLAARIAGFPPPGRDLPVAVTIEAAGDREVWTRDFGGHRFRSVLTLRGGRAWERFGPADFALGLAVEGEALVFPVLAARVFGRLPVPGALVPVSHTSETVDSAGRFRFDVRISLRSGARIAQYRGWLMPEAP